ncbi:MAG TPA: AMP-binding protein, partial [Dehalococcoidia bacterium]|nr:AMP-binding protein [Dehalococcoidia bacterium]
MAQGNFAWEPYGPYLERSRIRKFMDRHSIGSWQQLIERSANDIDWFWRAALEDLGVEWSQPYEQLYDDSRGMPFTRWFLGGRINIAQNCLYRHVRDGRGARTALLFEADDGSSRSITYADLQALVDRLAAAMAVCRIGEGDVVAMCLPISIEAVAIMLATLKVGAISMQIGARISPPEVVESLNRGQAKLLFMGDSYPRGGKWFDCQPLYEAALAEVPSLQRIVLLPRGEGRPLSDVKGIWWDDFLRSSYGGAWTLALDAEHPALVLFSSGTTGKSKAIVHSHGGALAQVIKEVGYAFD